MEKTQRETKLTISRLIMVQHELFFISLLLCKMVWLAIKAFHGTVPLIRTFGTDKNTKRQAT
jgi:hypothetical protein